MFKIPTVLTCMLQLAIQKECKYEKKKSSLTQVIHQAVEFTDEATIYNR